MIVQTSKPNVKRIDFIPVLGSRGRINSFFILRVNQLLRYKIVSFDWQSFKRSFMLK